MDQFDNTPDVYQASVASIQALQRLDAVLAEIAQVVGVDAQITDVDRVAWELTYGMPRHPVLVIARQHASEMDVRIAAIQASLARIKAKTELWDDASERQFEDDRWYFGRVVWVSGTEPFLRGHLERREVRPIASDIPRRVVQYLVAVPNTRDYVAREIHGVQWGYHYHYLDAKKRRSDTLLTFDPTSPNAAQPRLCWERHAEGHTFPARAENWGVEKRQSVYGVCVGDTTQWPLSAFKRPGADASTVWPNLPASPVARSQTLQAKPVTVSTRRK